MTYVQLLFHRPAVSLIAALLPLSLAGCCCGSFFYDAQAYSTWSELESAVGTEPTPVDKEQTGVAIQLPMLFASSETVPLRAGGTAGGQSISDLRIYPALDKDESPVLIKLPGLRFGYELPVYHETRSANVYCYLGVLPPGTAAATAAKEQILATVHAVVPEAQWENGKTLADGVTTADYLEVQGQQRYESPGLVKGVPAPSKLVIYLVKKQHANVLVAYRGPFDFTEPISLFKAGEASIATITSEKPPAPIDAPAVAPSGAPQGEYVTIPLVPLEMIPPTGYQVSNQIGGFQKQGSTTKITATHSPGPYSATIGTYNDTFFSNSNITQASREEVTITGKPATLMLLNRPKQTEWVLVLGDDGGSYVVTGTLADVDAEKAEVRAALLTVRKR